MTVDKEDHEALSWAGDAESGLAEFDPDAVQPAETTIPAIQTEPVVQKPLSAALLVSYGIFGGIYLLYLVGWTIFINTHEVVHTGELLPALMFELGEALTIVLPIFWFLAVFLLIRAERSFWRLFWLIAGVIVLIPWPFVLATVIEGRS
ncbi:MAG: hypothetical protein WBA28_09245 [Microbacteriaceae bacterium]